MFSLDVNIFSVNEPNLQPLSTANQLLTEFLLILTVSYNLPTKLAWFIDCYIGYRFFGIGSGWATFHLELVELMDVFKSNGYPENFKRRMQEDSNNWAKETYVFGPSLPWTIIIAK